MYKIMVVEDDLAIAKAIKNHLTRWNFAVFVVDDFKNITNQFQKIEPHLILLDIMLPFFNGFHWCSEIRKLSRVPVIFISSATDNMNIVMAVGMGGDDFIAKPFDLDVLTAKVKALLRRTYSFSGHHHTIESGGAILNLSNSTLSYGAAKVALTKNDLRILQLLMENSGTIVYRKKIMAHLWESDNFVDDNTLSVNINRLRRKLASLGLNDFIKTKKGLGYIVE